MVGANPKPRQGTARARTAAGGKVCPAAASLSASSAKDPAPGLVARTPAAMPTRGREQAGHRHESEVLLDEEGESGARVERPGRSREEEAQESLQGGVARRKDDEGRA